MNATSNGRVESLLVEPLTEGYKPTQPIWTLYGTDAVPQFYLRRDVELMMIHPVVRNVLDYYKGGVSQADFWGGPSPEDAASPQGMPISDSPEVSEFVLSQCRRWWERGVPKMQGGYEYGWIGGEPIYEDDGGLQFRDVLQFSPHDVALLKMEERAVGVRVRQVRNRPDGRVDLWAASKDVPAKGLWYAHNPRYHQFYGQSQLLGAWKPWRRLAWKDGAETNIDAAFYRGFYAGVAVRYPEEDYQSESPGPVSTPDSQGFPRRYARDVARQIAELWKSGASVGLSSEKYPPELGGGDKWSLETPQSKLNISGGVEYVKYLQDLISVGIGVPPELLNAQEGGGGYSGRAIPLEAFLAAQQRIADAMLDLFVSQILKPLVRWRFGEVPWKVAVKPLVMTKRQQQAGESGQAPGAPDATMPPPMPGTHQGNSHHPLAGQTPPPGQMDQGSAPISPYAGQAAGWQMSLEQTNRIKDVARRILAGRAA